MSGSLLLGLFAPGALEELLAGEMEGETLDSTSGILFAAMVVIPLVMAGVTLLVSDRVNRYLNLVAGLALALLGALPVMEILDGNFDGHVVMALTAAALGLLIAGLSVVELRKPTSPEANMVDAARVTV
jgi:membrane associated rhomboid family serine protease